MPLKKRLVDGDILDRHQPLGGFKLNNPVDQQKGISVRQEIHDLLNVEGHSTAPDSKRAYNCAASQGRFVLVWIINKPLPAWSL
jgi:hypothetical protein